MDVSMISQSQAATTTGCNIQYTFSKMGSPSRKLCVCTTITGVLGVACLVTGIVLITVFNNLIHDKIDSNLPLKNGSDSLNNWVSPPAPVYFQVWVFDVINSWEVINKGDKPYLVEKGPYTYKEVKKKGDLDYEQNETIIRYREKSWYYFLRNMSVGPETDSFITVNLPMVTIANMLKYEYGWIQSIAELVLEAVGEHLFINLTVADLLWGYEDVLLKDIEKLLNSLHINVTLDDRFGLFYNHNGSDDGLYKIHTGADTLDHFAEIVSWNGNKSLHFWTSDIANMINGSDGTLYPPFIDTSKSYYLFSSDLCRSLEITYRDSYDLKEITLKRFVPPSRTFANVTVNPFNDGFCTPKSNCLPSGLLNVSTCRQGAPVIFSLPHFLDGDLNVSDRVIGMNPIREQHQSVVDIEPMTGVVMNVAKRLQINVYLQNISHIKDTRNLHNYIIFPILWLNESATLDDKSASDFRSDVLQPLKITQIVQYGLIALGVFLIVCALIVIIKHIIRKRREPGSVEVNETSSLLTAT